MDPLTWRADIFPDMLGRERDDSILCGNSNSSLFIGVDAHLHAGCVVSGLLANQTGEHEWSKVDIFSGFGHRRRWLRCVYQ